MEEFKVAEDVAVKEVKAFIEYHLDEPIEEEQVKKDYKEVVKAIMRGNLNIDDIDAPILKLMKPIQVEGGGVDHSEIKFLTRITKSQLANLAKGLDLTKDPLGFANKMTAFFIQQHAVAILDKYGKHDLKVIDQLVGLFQ